MSIHFKLLKLKSAQRCLGHDSSQNSYRLCVDECTHMYICMCTHTVPTSDYYEASQQLPPLPKAKKPTSVHASSKHFIKMNLGTLKEWPEPGMGQ